MNEEVFAEIEILNDVIFDVLSHLFFSSRVSCREESFTLIKCLFSYKSCTKYKISTSIDACRFVGRKSIMKYAMNMI